MKLLFYSLCALALLARPAAAQTISNAGFETWAIRDSIEAPAGWLTTDDVFAYYVRKPTGTFNLGTVTKSTDAHSGSYAAKLTTTREPLTTGGSTLVQGILVLGAEVGKYNFFGIPLGGAPFNKRPTRMQFSYKFNGTAADSALALVYLSQAGSTNLSGVSAILLSPSNSYITVAIPITYDPTDTSTPDSIHIVFASGYSTHIGKANSANIQEGSTLLVDDISLSGGGVLATRADAGTQAQLTVSPNPSPAGLFQLAAPAEPALASAAYTVSDMLGRVVARQPAQATPTPERTLDLSNLRTGIYLLRLDSKQGVITRQLVVK